MATIEMTCPWCLRQVHIDEAQFRSAAEFRCPECGSTAPWAPDPRPLDPRARGERKPAAKR